MKLIGLHQKVFGLICILCLLCSGLNQAHAADVTGSLEICEGHVLPVRLDDVVGLGLSAGGGSWNEVNPTDGSVISKNVSNVFLGIDRLPGTYQFVFIPSNNPCMVDEDRAIATIKILEIAKPVSHFISLCEGEPVNFDIASLISPSLKAKYTIDYKDAAGAAMGSSTTVTFTAKGEYIYSYEVQGIAPCKNVAAIVINVTGGDILENVDLNDIMAYCISSVPESVNLMEDIGVSASGGSWTTSPGAPAISSTGVVRLTGVAVGEYVYTYTWTDSCTGTSYSKTLTIKITDDLTNEFVAASRDICKAVYGNSIVYLSDILGVSLPANSGVWSEIEAKSPVDVADGIFELADARTGKYVYTYTIGNAVGLCGLTGRTASVTLNIFDGGEVLDGEVQLCKANLTPGSTLDLAEYMVSLPAGGTWYDGAGTAVSGSTINSGSLALGVHAYKYEFNAGPCGNGTADMYVVVTDMITNFKDKAKSYCLTDDGANAIDLDQVLGIGNVAGTWTNNKPATNYNAATHVFDGRTEGVGTYTFTFTATEDACGISVGDSVTVTITITNDLTN